MKRFQARKAVLQALKQKGLYIETKDNPMVVPTCRSENPCRLYKKVILIFIITLYKMDNFCCFFFLKDYCIYRRKKVNDMIWSLFISVDLKTSLSPY